MSERDDDDDTSRASLSFVPNRATTKSLAPGGWRSMTTWPMAATSDVAPASRPASSSETPSAAAVATPGDAAPPESRPRTSSSGRRARWAVLAVVLTGRIIAAPCDVRVSGIRAHAPPVAALDGDRQPERRGSGRRRAGRPRSARRRPPARRPARARARSPAGSPRRGGRRGRWPPAGLARPARARSREQRLAGAEVQAGRRLVEEQQVRVRHQRPGDRGPPPLAGRQRPERLVGDVGRARAVARSAAARARSRRRRRATTARSPRGARS